MTNILLVNIYLLMAKIDSSEVEKYFILNFTTRKIKAKNIVFLEITNSNHSQKLVDFLNLNSELTLAENLIGEW